MNFAQWSVWLANLDPIVGSEQGRTTPVLVISDGSINEILPVVNVIPSLEILLKQFLVLRDEMFIERKFEKTLLAPEERNLTDLAYDRRKRCAPLERESWDLQLGL